MSKSTSPPRKLHRAATATAFRVGMALALLAVACRSSSLNEGPSADISAEERARDLISAEAPSLELLVALSEELALASAQAEAQEASRIAKIAGDLRARAFRIGHAEADARATLALYAHAVKSKGRGACEAAVQHAVISAELARDPGLFYREAYVTSRVFPDCAASVEALLSPLRVFRPDPETIELLDREARRRRGEGVEAATSENTVSIEGDSGLERDVQANIPSGPTSAEALQLESIDPYGSRDRARIVLTLSGETTFEAGSLGRTKQAPDRVYIDLAKVEASPREIAVGGIVERLRLAPRNGGSRLVLDLSAPASHRVFYLPEPFRLVIDIATEASPRLSAPKGAPRPVRRIAIDPGHGGHDPGAIGPSGLREKDITLDIAHRVAPILARELGMITLLTRDDDRYVPLAERTARANAFHADLFVSIHCNASESSTARGIATFVLDTTRDETLAKIAARENATSLSASLQLMDVGTLGPLEVGARSRKLAELLDRTAMASLSPRWADTSSYGVKAAGFFVLVGAEMPSVLFETSFISNPIEEARLATPDYRQKLADAIVNAVRGYREGR